MRSNNQSNYYFGDMDDANQNKSNYKSFAVKLSLWAQGRGIPGASPAWLTRAAARIAKSRNPKLVEKFIRAYSINHTQADRCSVDDSARECAEKYGSLSKFFTRGIRNIRVANSPLVSPATCKAMLFETFDDSRIWVKGRSWSASCLIGVNVNFSDFAVGVFRLRPADYHRFHSPFAGTIESITHLPGGYLSVDPAIVSKRNVFTENNRYVVVVRSPVYGRCYFVAIGAAGVGSVRIFEPEQAYIAPGQLLGAFDFGGSTVVVLVPRRPYPVWREDIVENSLAATETFVNVGEDVHVSI